MSKKTKSEGRSPWLPETTDTPGPDHYNPNTKDHRIPISMKGHKDLLPHETIGPGPGGYNIPGQHGPTGPKWPPPKSAPSSRRNSFSKMPSKSKHDPKNIGHGSSGAGHSLTSSMSFVSNTTSDQVIDSGGRNNNISDNIEDARSDTSSNASPQTQRPNIYLLYPNEAEPAVINIDTQDPNSVYPVGEDNSSKVKDDTNPPIPGNSGNQARGSARSAPRGSVIFLPVPPNQSPFSWLTDGKLSIFGVIAAACTFVLGIIHLGLWSKSGTCIFSGVWMMIWGLLILVTEGMLLPKITLFNRLEILYPMTRLINSRHYWVKTILYAVLAITAIAVCSKWSTGLGGGLLIALSFAYGLKQIDQNYKNRQEDFNRIRRHEGSHVPVWTLS